MNILELKNVDRVYHVNNIEFYALKDINLKIREGEMLVILGQSGSGKSTLMNVISGLDRATSGHVFYKNEDLAKYNEIELEKYRRNEVGFIFQTYNLIPNLKISENIELGLKLSKSEDNTIIEELLGEFELTKYKDSFPYQLSGGGKQRVAISRALAKRPRLLMCDEPTGALDEKNAIKVIKKLQEFNEKYNTTIVVITHNPVYAKAGHRAIYINDGRITKEIVNEKITKAEDLEFSGIFGVRS
jgi:putative ABC transport system ATP-binding protein